MMQYEAYFPNKRWQRYQKQSMYVKNVAMNRQNGFGKCPACNEWNTFFEQKLETKEVEAKREKRENSIPVALKTVQYKEISRISTGFGELDRVLRTEE